MAKPTEKQVKYIMDLAKKATPLRQWEISNEHHAPKKHKDAVVAFREDISKLAVSRCKSALKSKPTKQQASNMISILRDKENGFVPEVFEKLFAKVVDKHNKHGTFNKAHKAMNPGPPWHPTGWEKHSKTVSEEDF